MSSPVCLTSEELLGCCGSTEWVRRMLTGNPYPTGLSLVEAGRRTWASLAPDDWREAFAAHPRIGDRPPSGSQESREQSGMNAADAELRRRLADGNAEYETRFGMTYIVRATGRSATEMLELLQQRLRNDPEQEIAVAAQQQWEITELRLRERLNILASAQEVP